MKKEDLIKMGLSETQADSVLNTYTESLKGFIPKSRFDEVNEAKKTAETQINEYKTQIETLSKSSGNVEDLQKQIETFKNEMTQKDIDYQNKVKDLTVSSALKLALNGKVHDIDIVSKLLDTKSFEIDDNGLITKGLDEQITKLKESKSFLFVPEVTPQPTPTPTPQPHFRLGGNGGEPKPTPAPVDLLSALQTKFNK